MQVPLLLMPEAKSRILQGEASVQKQHMVQSSAVNALLQVRCAYHIVKKKCRCEWSSTQIGAAHVAHKNN